MRLIKRFYDTVALVSECSSSMAKWLLVVVTSIIVYDVVMRYVFNAPTNWAFASSYMLVGSFAALGWASVHYHRKNIRIDVIYTKFSTRLKLIVDIIFSLLFFFPLFFFISIVFVKDTWNAFMIHQVAPETTWYPVVWPFRTAVTLGLVLLFLQGIATFLKDVMTLIKGGKEPW